MEIYIVRSGDTLWSIARKYGISPTELAARNQLSDPNRIVVGAALIVGGASTPRQSIEVNAYAYPNITEAVMEQTLPYVTYFCPFSYQFTAGGELIPPNDSELIALARDYLAAPLLTLTNIGENGGFSSDLAHTLFTDSAVQDAVIENMLAVLRQKGYYGVNFNIEYVYPFDREGYNSFLRRTSELLHAEGYFVSTAIAPKTSDSQEGILYYAHDYAAHGQYADRVIIMTYEWGYTYGAPQAVSPVNRMRQVIEYAVSRIPAGKILLGFSNYGYNWKLPWKQGDAASVISNSMAVNLAVSNWAEIKFDAAAQAPYFTYTDATGQRRVVWFEDVRSVQARLNLVAEYGLAGISYWTINQLYLPGLRVLESTYSVEKII